MYDGLYDGFVFNRPTCRVSYTIILKNLQKTTISNTTLSQKTLGRGKIGLVPITAASTNIPGAGTAPAILSRSIGICEKCKKHNFHKSSSDFVITLNESL